jgi:hypothetical protein
MATSNNGHFVIKSVKAGPDGKKFYSEIGRMIFRETEKGVSASVFLHQNPDAKYVAFPAEPKAADAAPAA